MPETPDDLEARNAEGNHQPDDLEDLESGLADFDDESEPDAAPNNEKVNRAVQEQIQRRLQAGDRDLGDVREKLGQRSVSRETLRRPHVSLKADLDKIQKDIKEQHPDATKEELQDHVSKELTRKAEEKLETARSAHFIWLKNFLRDRRPELSDDDLDRITAEIDERLTSVELESFYVQVRRNKAETDEGKRTAGKEKIIGRIAAVLGPEADLLAEDLYNRIANDPETLREVKIFRSAAHLAARDIAKAEDFAELVDKGDDEALAKFIDEIDDNELRAELNGNLELIRLADREIEALRPLRIAMARDVFGSTEGFNELDDESLVALGRIAQNGDAETIELLRRNGFEKHPEGVCSLGSMTRKW